MKALIIADNDNLIDLCGSVLKNAGCEIIIYRWLLKALDNIEEIAPDIIAIDAGSYPRHWKIVAQYTASTEVGCRLFLFSEKQISSSEMRKADFLGIEKIFCLDSEDTEENFAECFKQEKNRKNPPTPSESEETECIFALENGIITGRVLKFTGDKLFFLPDFKSKIPENVIGTKITNLAIKRIADDTIFNSVADVKSCNGGILELELKGLKR